MIDQIFKSLSDRNRLTIVGSLLTVPELCACQITELLQVSGATVSKHVGILVNAGLVTSRKEGRWVYYQITADIPHITSLFDWITKEIHHDAGINQRLIELQKIIRIDPEELCKKQRNEQCCS